MKKLSNLVLCIALALSTPLAEAGYRSTSKSNSYKSSSFSKSSKSSGSNYKSPSFSSSKPYAASVSKPSYKSSINYGISSQPSVAKVKPAKKKDYYASSRSGLYDSRNYRNDSNRNSSNTDHLVNAVAAAMIVSSINNATAAPVPQVVVVQAPAEVKPIQAPTQPVTVKDIPNLAQASSPPPPPPVRRVKSFDFGETGQPDCSPSTKWSCE